MADVQQLAETTLGKSERFSVKAELQRAASVLHPNETVTMIAVGNYRGGGNSLLIATDQRLVALNQTGAFMSKKLQVHDVRYDRVSSVQSASGRVSGSVTLNTAGGDVDIEKILPSGRADELAAFIRSKM